MNDSYIYAIIGITLFVFLAYWLFKLFTLGSNTSKTDTSTKSSPKFFKGNFNTGNTDFTTSPSTSSTNSNSGSLSTVNSFLYNQELNTKKYLVKTEGGGNERIFDTGPEEDRLLKAEKYYSFVLQNFRFSQIRKEPLIDTGNGSINISLICIANNNGVMEETIIKSNKENVER
jgi:hypothetical protein